jgi:hypothetical protein
LFETRPGSRQEVLDLWRPRGQPALPMFEIIKASP